MLKKVRDLFLKHGNILSYLIFGGLTTLVNFMVYFPLLNWLKLSAVFSNAIAWIAAVSFAYLTNKPFVFKSNDWSMKTVLPELSKFIGCRIVSGLLETIVLWFFVDLLLWDGNWIKIIVSFLVVVLNYISSRWVVFQKEENV